MSSVGISRAPRLVTPWLGPVLLIAMGVCSCAPAPSALGAAFSNKRGAETERIRIAWGMADSSSELAPITLDQIVSSREIEEARLSPDGERVAFVVKQGFRDCNCIRRALYVAPSDGGQPPSKLLEAATLNSVRWRPHSTTLSFLAGLTGTVQLWSMPATGGTPELLLRHRPDDGNSFIRRGWSPEAEAIPIGVSRYEWSPDGRRLAFSTTLPSDSSARRRALREGLQYDDNAMTLFNLVLEQWAPSRSELWLYDCDTMREHRLWLGPTTHIDGGVLSISWSPDGDRVAFSHIAAPLPGESRNFWNTDVSVVGVDGVVTSVIATGAWEDTPRWSPDGSALAVARTFSILDKVDLLRIPLDSLRAWRVVGRVDRSTELLGWSEDGTALLVQASGLTLRREMTGLYSVPMAGVPMRLTPDSLRISSCAAIEMGRFACVREAPALAPAVSVVRVGKQSRGDESVSIDAIADPNPEMSRVLRVPIRPLRWTNRYGAETDGYLLLPPHRRPGERLPLLIITYGFTGEFVTHGWRALTSYPALVFASEGFAVLLANPQRYEPWTGADYSRGSEAVGFGPAASLEEATRQLAAEGIVDSTRVGMMGTSYGGFWVEFMITQSRLIAVASIRNAGDYNPGIYWLLGNAFSRARYEAFMGGPPFGSTLEHWKDFAPALNAEKVRAPVLMEFQPLETLYGLEMFAALRRNSVPVELFIYPNGGHVFWQPEHRFHSMQRNLDWFRFWLLGVEDTASGREGQFARWRELRSQLNTLGQTASVAP